MKTPLQMEMYYVRDITGLVEYFYESTVGVYSSLLKFCQFMTAINKDYTIIKKYIKTAKVPYAGRRKTLV